MSNNYLIYKHTSPSGKSYIGQTNRYKLRCYEHQNQTGCRLFYKAIKKYGWDSFTHEILATGLTLESSNHFEEFFIKSQNTLVPNGYNLTSGGDNSKPSIESKRKMSESSKGKKHSTLSIIKMSLSHKGEKNHFYGKRHTQESISKISESKKGEKNYWFGRKGHEHPMYGKTGEKCHMYGRKHTKESLEKMSKAKKGKKHSKESCEKMSLSKLGEKHHLFGKKHKPESIQKMKDAKKGEKHYCFGKFGYDNIKSKTYKITSPNGIIEIIKGLRKYCRENNLNQGAMCSIANGKKKSYKGYKCEYFIEDKI